MKLNVWTIAVATWLLAGSLGEAQVRPVSLLPAGTEASHLQPDNWPETRVELDQVAAQLKQQSDEIEHLRGQIDKLNNDAPSSDTTSKNITNSDITSNDTKAANDPLSFHGKWENSLWFESENGDFRANIGGRVEQDMVWFQTDPNLETAIGSMEDGWFFRRARIHGAGTMYGVIDMIAEFEAAPVDHIVFQDVWAQLRDIPIIGHIRVGHVKVPFGLENVDSAKYLTFMERSAVHDAFQQEYDPGIMAWNYGPEKNTTWALAWMRLDPDESGRSFGNGKYSGVGRVTMVPWSANDDASLVHLGGGYRYDNGGVLDPTLGVEVVQFRSRPELRNTSRFVDTGPLSASGASFMLFESAVMFDSLTLRAEYIHTTVHDASIPLAGPELGNVMFDGYHLHASYILTGERRPYDRTNGTFGRIIPSTNVRPATGNLLHQGAWEIAVRYSNVDLNDPGVNGGVLQTLTTGLTWYLNPNTKVLFNYIWAQRDVPGPSVDGGAHLFGTRFHIAF